MNIHVDESMYDPRAVDVEKEPSESFDKPRIDENELEEDEGNYALQKRATQFFED